MTSDRRARTYHRWRFWLSIAGFLLTTGYLASLIVTGASSALRDRLVALTPRWWIQLALGLVVIGAGQRVLSVPLAWLSGFWLPRRYGLLHQPFHLWLWDAMKASLIGGLLGLCGAEIVYALLLTTPSWWLYGAAIFFVGYALLAWVMPVWLVPLFYRLHPLGEGSLRERLVTLAVRAGVPVVGVWVADQSTKSRTANAAVVGLRGTRRILLFDTLVAQFTPDEVEVVLAHELGHQVHRDVGRGLLVQGVLTLVTFWVADHWLRAGAERLGFHGPADPAALPLFGLVLIAVGLVALPLANGWSRHVERQADEFALRTASNPAAFIDAMERLATLNLAERDPHFVKEFLLYSHPSIGRRVARARTRLRQAS